MRNDLPGVIEPGRLYVVAEARQRLRLGDTSWRKLRKTGLKIIYQGRQAYVFSDDLLRLFAQLQTDQHPEEPSPMPPWPQLNTATQKMGQTGEGDFAVPCTRCGQPATHRHIDQIRSLKQHLCDHCCDRNCEHFTAAYNKTRTTPSSREKDVRDDSGTGE
jgi:hypothetical protein